MEKSGICSRKSVASGISLRAVLTYIRQAWGNSASAVNSATVKRLRESTQLESGARE
jgi:hypothetical protein